MKIKYVLDACALIAFLADEKGAEKVESLLTQAENNKILLYLHKINLIEINYGILRSDGAGIANEIIGNISTLPLQIIDKIDDDLFKWASFFKSKYKISLADSFALGLSKIKNAQLVTSDHHEFDAIDKDDIIKIFWIR